MLTLDTIFISITFFILSLILIKMKAPKVIIPLSLIYIFFIFNKLQNSHNNISSEDKDKKNKTVSSQPQNNSKKEVSIENDQIQKAAHKDVRIERKRKEDKKELEIQVASVEEKKQKQKKQKSNSKIKKKNEPNQLIKEKEKKPTFDNTLTLKEIKICKNIKNRNPIGVGEVFPSSVDSLYCFTKIQNLGKKMEVRHVWYYENQIMTQVRYNVKKSNVYRSWTKKTISSFQIGNWRVEVQDRNGTIIGTKKFKIKKSS